MSSLTNVTTSAPSAGERTGSVRPFPSAVADEPPPTDHELLDRCVAGDEQAWIEVVGRYERLVFSVALKNGLSREDAADVTQVTFVALLESIPMLRSDGSLAAWLMTVARRHAWRARRRAAIEQPGSLDVVEPDSSTDEDYARLATLHEGLARLGERCRQLLYALFFDPDAPPYAVVAERLHCAIGTIGPQRARCLHRLRVLLDEEEQAG
jgi:RNA polymerase sigma factor (sigma-70 family)